MVLQQAKQKVEIFIFGDMLRYFVDCINHIHIYFVSTNAVEAIARVDMLSLSSKNEKCRKFYFFADLLRCLVDCINPIHMQWNC